MTIVEPLETDTLQQLVQLVETNRDDLENRIELALRQTLFANRAEIRPNMLKSIASEDVSALLDFLDQPTYPSLEHGRHLYQIGLSEQVVLRLSQIMHLFCLPHLTNNQIAPMLEIIDIYQIEVMKGFIQALQNDVFKQQELTRQAFERAIKQD
jgi:hypothetical protein